VTTDGNFLNALKQILEKYNVNGIVVGKTHYLEAEERKNIVLSRLSTITKVPYT
jgi:RNase H-fold protein (predicted Holliday junction resolvase)